MHLPDVTESCVSIWNNDSNCANEDPIRRWLRNASLLTIAQEADIENDVGVPLSPKKKS